MGASSFTLVSKDNDVNVAFRTLVKQAGHANGYEYSGTISSVHDYTVRNDRRNPVSAAMAAHIVEEELDTISKWEPCHVIAVGNFSTTTTKTIQLTTNGELPDLHLVAQTLGVKPGQVDQWKSTLRTSKRKVTVTYPETTTKVWVVSDQCRGAGREYRTKREALAAAKQLAGEASGLGTRQVYVWQSTANANRIVVASESMSSHWDVRAVIGNGECTFSHWLFYGMAPC